jgi:hypothetical protein
LRAFIAMNPSTTPNCIVLQRGILISANLGWVKTGEMASGCWNQEATELQFLESLCYQTKDKMEVAGIEPATFCMLSRRDYQLRQTPDA